MPKLATVHHNPVTHPPNRPLADSPMRASSNATPQVLLIGFSSTEQRELQAQLHAHRLPVWPIDAQELHQHLVDHAKVSVIVHRTSAASTFNLDWVEEIRTIPSVACRSEVLGFRTMPRTEGAGNQAARSQVLLDLRAWAGTTRILTETGSAEFRAREILDAVTRATHVRDLITLITNAWALTETARRGITVAGTTLSAANPERPWPHTTQDGLRWPESTAVVSDGGTGHARPVAQDRPARAARRTTASGIAALVAEADLSDAHFPDRPLTDWQWPVFLRIVSRTLCGEGITAQELSAEVQVPGTSLWRFVERLKAEGLIEETRRQRRRPRRITATPRSIALTEALAYSDDRDRSFRRS
jgi:DNA-binding MarR family transcriptional regulator